MPNPSPATQPLVVTGEDREAAAKWYEGQFGDEAPMRLIRAGDYDHGALVQAFATHAATAREMGRGPRDWCGEHQPKEPEHG